MTGHNSAPINTSPLPAGGEGWGGVADLANLALSIALGVFDEHYSPVQRLTLITAIDMYSLVLVGSREQPIITSAANFWGYFRSMDYPAAYAEALSIQRV